MRDCSRHTTQEPYVLAIFYDNRVFNVQIRFCKETCKYTLGTRIKTDDVSSVTVSVLQLQSRNSYPNSQKVKNYDGIINGIFAPL